jgi:hypothetical protein
MATRLSRRRSGRVADSATIGDVDPGDSINLSLAWA